MALDKQPSTAPGQVTVTFRVPGDIVAESAALVGEFTDWEPVAMDPVGGAYEVAVDLAGGERYRFRYLIDGDRWDNDWYADGYVANDYGSEDSVVDLTAMETGVVDLTGAEADERAEPEPAPKAAKRTRAPRKKSSTRRD